MTSAGREEGKDGGARGLTRARRPTHARGGSGVRLGQSRPPWESPLAGSRAGRNGRRLDFAAGSGRARIGAAQPL